MPRAGAWYPVVGEAGDERFVLQIRGKRVAIHKKLLELRPERPRTFTVVVRTRDTAATAAALRGEIDRTYAVCPACTNRVRILPDQSAASCPECSHRGEVAWWETG
jgi:Zn finger protein HypA/HybF involved in hydrogenase expression